MNTMTFAGLLIGAVAGSLATNVKANDNVATANYEIQSVLGVAGRAYFYTQEYSHANGAMICKSSASSGSITLTFPIVVPDAQLLRFITFTGKRTTAAPPLELRVKKSCMKWTEVHPSTTTLQTSAPTADSEGFFTSHLSLGDEQPNNYDCKYWAEASINVSGAKCTDGDLYIQKITVWSGFPDRIFRGSFHTNVTRGTP